MVVSYCKFGGLGLCLQLNKELISSMSILVGSLISTASCRMLESQGENGKVILGPHLHVFASVT